MPKETIHPKYHGTSDSPEPSTEVRWGRDQYCQIATVMPDGVPFPKECGPEANGWYASLNRDGINQLIRVLRRARDAAYGADA